VTKSVCFKCGTDKSLPFDVCSECGAKPQTDDDRQLSFILSSLFSSPDRLDQHSARLKAGRALALLPGSMENAQIALSDNQLVAMLGGAAKHMPAPPVSSSPQPRPAIAPGRYQMAPRKPRLAQVETTLHRSPFHLLGATIRDDRKRIVELAEEKSLELDYELCQKARADLTSPRNRLSAEIAWFAGVAPRRAVELMGRIRGDLSAAEAEAGLPVLAHLNFFSAAFEVAGSELGDEELVLAIEGFADLADELDASDILRDINEDRSVSGFPEVPSVNQVEEEIEARRRVFQSVIKKALDRRPAASIVRVMTMLVDNSTASGRYHAPRLVDDLVDSYETESQEFLEREAENVRKLLAAIRSSIGVGQGTTLPFIESLETVVQNWDRVAQPIQLNAKARGINHDSSRALAYEIRSVAIDLFNDHDMLLESQRITKLLQNVFSEVPDVAERLDQDSDALAEVFEDRKKSSEFDAEWSRNITYSAEIGLIFKDTLKIGPDGITWKNKTYRLEAITRVRWGGVRHSVNGVPTGSTFTIAFGDENSESVVDLKKEAVFSTFIGKLWQAVGVRLLIEMLGALKAGKEFSMGGGVLHDDGITLIKHKFLSSNTGVRCAWQEVRTWSADGNLYIGAKNDKKTYIGLSYIHAANTHIIEQVILMAFKRPGLKRLSELLQ
jgi:hypothetical protein